MKTKIAFIGLGNMGLPMALNLTKSKKLKVVGYDINIRAQKRFKSKGGKISDSLEDLINSVDVIITCLPGPKQITNVAFGKKRIINNLDKKKIWIDCSTNSTSCFNKIKKKLGDRIVNFIDAPISGGKLKAKSGELSIFVGGKKSTFNKVKMILNLLGKNIYVLETFGAGYAAKIAQVSLCYLNYLSLSEALMIGVKSGIKPKLMLDIIDKSASGGFTSSKYGPHMIDGSYDSSFSLGLSYKDLILANEIIRSKKMDLPVTNLTTKIYNKALKKYGEKVNHLEVVKLIEESNKKVLHKS